MTDTQPTQPTEQRVPPARVPFDREQRSREMGDFPPADVRDKGRVECLRCHELLPFDQFESLTDPFCFTCRATAAEAELQEMRARACNDFSRKLALGADDRMPLEHIESFLAELMYDFGGMRVFVKEWYEQLTAAFRARPGSAANLAQCRSIAKLVMECNKLQHQEDVLDLSDEQLRVKKELALMDMLTSAAGDPHRRRMLIELIRSNGMKLDDVPGIQACVEASENGN